MKIHKTKFYKKNILLKANKISQSIYKRIKKIVIILIANRVTENSNRNKKKQNKKNAINKHTMTNMNIIILKMTIIILKKLYSILNKTSIFYQKI